MLRIADNAMVPKLKELWKICFGDSDEYVNNFFENAYAPKRTLVSIVDNSVAGAAYLFPCKIGNRRASYLYAGGVFPEFRRRGIYEEMMKAWADWCIERDIIPFLKPADGRLWEYYTRIGFNEFMGGKRVFIENGGTDECEISRIDAPEFVAMREKYLDFPYIKWQHMDYILKENELCGGDCVKVVTSCGEFAMIYVVVDDTLYVRGFAGDIAVLRACAMDLMEKIPSNRICVTVNGDDMRLTAAVGAEKICCGMADLLMD